jgi:ATP synthase protein I
MVRAASRGAGFWKCRDGAGVDVMSDEIMSDNARGTGDPGDRPTDEAALSARLRHLGEQLGHEQPGRSSENASGARPATDASGFARGFRLSTELVAGVLVGAFLGWLLDRWLGISPWRLIVFLLLGFAAGVINVMRAAGVNSGGPTGRPS